MKIIDRIIGVWMMIAGAGLFAYALSLEPYMDTLSGYTLYIITISTAILLSGPSAALSGFGLAQAAGVISIKIEGGK